MDFCCGTSMIGRLAPLHTEAGALITDVPFLFCHTCGQTVVAPDVLLDVTMFTHYCETDGVKSASLYDVVDKERIQGILYAYPEPVTDYTDFYVDAEQLDHMLDLWNFASSLDDQQWKSEIKEVLLALHKVRSRQRLPQSQH
ncbi:MAG: hypothetical protein OWT28_03480 [Firmicutes bacterium]|nr:hypothetical protein [Bacillota bacterium]